MISALKKDIDIVLPVANIVTASAGAGKTHALTHKYVQLLLSKVIPRNALPNILAVTFTNNAATEMKQRILRLLKLASLGDKETLRELHEILSMEEPEIRLGATRLLNDLLDNYSDFQVKTIDSFMATVFKSASIEYGFHPEFEILLNTDKTFDLAFDLFSRELEEGSPQVRVVENLIRLIAESKGRESNFVWDPYRSISSYVKKIYTLLAAQIKPLDTTDLSGELTELKKKVAHQASLLKKVILRSGLTMNQNSVRDFELIDAGDIAALIGKTLKKTPVNKPKVKSEMAAYEKWIPEIEAEQDTLNGLLTKAYHSYAMSFYQPYSEAYTLLEGAVTQMKKRYGEIFIDDVNKTLAAHLTAEAVPEVYFRIGDTVYHYLVDEFQDTSLIQWKNLFPLIEESLSKGGSLFVVGDTKQSIYGFRDADWRIMKHLTEANPFPSARHEVDSLAINFRSAERIVDFSRSVFHDIIPSLGYDKEAAISGLSTFHQEVKKEERGKGYAEVALLMEGEGLPAEKAKILSIVEECRARGYHYNEIALLTPANTDVVEASSWLNEKKIPIISHSTLDVRRRKSAGEFIALLRFLDSPVDDLSFSTFILGDLFGALLAPHALHRGDLEQFIFDAKRRENGPLYTAFRSEFSTLWDQYFEHLFNVVGYLPLYDLLSEALKIFDAFATLPDEEAAFVKLLEVVEAFEQEGTNTIKDFLRFSDDETSDDAWRIDVPRNIDAMHVMTVHKAKGIEFPVVIVLLYDHQPRGTGYLLDEGEDSVRIVKVNKEIAAKVEELQELLDRERFMDTVDSFNKLYVAFTRAKKEMYVVGVYKKELREPSRFLPADLFVPGPKPDAVSAAAGFETGLPLYHHTKRRSLLVQEQGAIGTEESKRGDVVHRILSAIEFLSDDPSRQLDEILSMMDYDIQAPKETLKYAILEFLSDARVRPFFLPGDGRVVLREQELTNGAGALYRADRILCDRDEVTVIDFKTGDDKNELEYLGQVRNYMKILREIFPGRTMLGLIAYVDLKQTRSVA